MDPFQHSHLNTATKMNKAFLIQPSHCSHPTVVIPIQPSQYKHSNEDISMQPFQNCQHSCKQLSLLLQSNIMAVTKQLLCTTILHAKINFSPYYIAPNPNEQLLCLYSCSSKHERYTSTHHKKIRAKRNSDPI